MPTLKNQPPGPQPLTIEQYRLRQQLNAEQKRMVIPQTEKPKHRRGGRIVRLRRRRAFLKSLVNAETPPPWHVANELWLEIIAIDREMETRT